MMSRQLKPSQMARAMRARPHLLRALVSEVEALHMSVEGSVLILGGGIADEQLLRQAGFKHIVNSNLPSNVDLAFSGRESVPDAERVALDAEEIDLPSDSFDLVFASEVLHHCSSPHRALCEMIRVARHHVVFMEPNDSFFMNALVKMNFSFPYELAAVIDHDYESGGLRDSHIPNFIYRWNQHEVVKTVSAFIPERKFAVRARPYWDFDVKKEDLELRKATRIGTITSIIGTGNFIRLLRLAQFFLNSTSTFRKQGNKFFCCIEKSSDLKPWMARQGEHVVFNRAFGNGNHATPA
jgi:SAM-dependent methyltransferase